MAKNTRDIVRFEGHLGTDQVDQLLLDLHEKLVALDIGLLTRKRIYSASVECLDNISKHADVESISEEQFRQYPSFFRLREDEEGFKIQVSNVLQKIEADTIEQRLKKLNQLSREQVYELFKDTIRQGATLSDKGGAGLGLIVLAKTTRQPMSFRFTPIGTDHAYFTLIIRISR